MCLYLSADILVDQLLSGMPNSYKNKLKSTTISSGGITHSQPSQKVMPFIPSLRLFQYRPFIHKTNERVLHFSFHDLSYFPPFKSVHRKIIHHECENIQERSITIKNERRINGRWNKVFCPCG